MLTAVGLTAGLALGLPLVEYFGARGLDLSGYASGLQSIPGLTGIIRPVFVPASLVGPFLLLLGLSVLAALYPAWRAARLQPAAAIRHA